MLCPGSKLAQPPLPMKHRDMKDVLNLMLATTQTRMPPCSMGELMAAGRPRLQLCIPLDPQCLPVMKTVQETTAACTTS